MKHMLGSNHNIVQLVSKLIIQPHKSHQQEKEPLFQKVVIQKKSFQKVIIPKFAFFFITYDFFGVKTVLNNDEPSEYRTYLHTI